MAEFDYESTVRIVTDAVLRNGKGFTGSPDVGVEDLVSEFVVECWKAWPRFDSAKGQYSTLVNRIVFNRLRDRRRGLKSRRKHDRGAARHRGAINGGIRVREHSSDRGTVLLPTSMNPHDEQEATDDFGDFSQPITEWLADVYLRARRRYGLRRPGKGPQRHSPALIVAVLALKHRFKRVSADGLHVMLRDRPELRQILRIEHVDDVPHARNLRRWLARMSDKYGRISANNNPRTMKKRLQRSEYIDEPAAAALLGVAHVTLKLRRLRGKPIVPAYFPTGPGGLVRYKRTECNAHMEKNRLAAEGEEPVRAVAAEPETPPVEGGELLWQPQSQL